MASRRGKTLLCALLAGLSLGCDPLARARECNELADLANPLMGEIAAELKRPLDATTLQRIVERYGRLRAGLEAFEPKVAPIGGELAAYRDVIAKAAQAAEELRIALDTGESRNQARAVEALKALNQNESQIVRRLATRCKAH